MSRNGWFWIIAIVVVVAAIGIYNSRGTAGENRIAISDNAHDTGIGNDADHTRDKIRDSVRDTGHDTADSIKDAGRDLKNSVKDATDGH